MITWRRATLRADLTLLRQRRFALLFTGRAVTMFGTAFGPMALAFGVLSLAGATPTTLSIVLTGHAVPQLALMLFGGAIGDRFPRHQVLVAGQVLSGSAFGGMAAMLLTGWAPLAALTGCAVLAGCGSTLLLPVLTSAVRDVVGREQLQPANALLRLGGNTANIVGLAGAGGAIALLGPGTALLVTALAYLAAGWLLRGLRPGTAAPRPDSAGSTSAVDRRGRWLLADVRVGVREFASRQWLWVVVLSAAILNAGTAAGFGVLGPVLAVDRLGGAVPWSIIMIGYSAGTLVSVVLALRLRPARPLLAASLVTPLLAAPMVALGAASPLGLTVAAALLAGMAFNVFGVWWETTVQQQIPAGVLARVISVNYLVALSIRPLGILVAGHFATSSGPGPTILVLGIVMLAAGLAVLASSQVRNLSTTETEQCRD